MKVYTEKDLEWFERDDFGRLICPRRGVQLWRAVPL